MSKFSLRDILFVTALTLTISGMSVRTWFVKSDGGSSPAGQTIVNQAGAVYTDASGISYATSSQSIIITVGAVSGISLTPDETEPSAVIASHQQATRVFRLCNSGNISNAYIVSDAEITAPARFISLHFDIDANGILSPADQLIEVGTTVSQTLEPEDCLNIIVVIDADNSAPQTSLKIRLKARANTTETNGAIENEGVIINTIGQMATLTDPDNNALPPRSLVEGKDRAVVSLGQSLNYSIAFRNSGGVDANNVTIIDDLDPRLEYVANSLVIEQRLAIGATAPGQTNIIKTNGGGTSNTAASNTNSQYDTQVSGRRVTIHFDKILPGQFVQIAFKAILSEQIPPGTGFINTAVITGENTATVITKSSDSIAIVSPSGMIYSGSSGGSVAVGGAHVVLATEETGGNPVATISNKGFLPNESNSNPFTTDIKGSYSFVLAPDQLGTPTAPIRYFMNVTADSYRTRMIEVLIRPTESGLFAATIRALDGQPIAKGNSLELTQESVLLENLASLGLNIPMFESSKLEITKSADKRNAEIGDTVSYRVEVRNATAVSIDNVIVRDELPQSFHYASGTGRLTGAANAQTVEPEISGNNLIFRLGKLEPKASAVVGYRVRIGANARQGEQINSASTEGTFPTGEKIQTLPARAAVTIGGGIFSMQQVILGRVFEDANANGVYDKDKDQPIPNVRIYMDNGQSVITDSEGLYNFPSVRDGSVVIALDPLSLPGNFSLSDKPNRTNVTKLLRTPLGGGGLLRQNFALQSTRKDNSDLQAQASKFVNSPANKNEGKQNSSVKTSSLTSGENAAKNGKAVQPVSRVPGTYEIEATEKIKAVLPGKVLIVSPQPNEVVGGAALELKARVALNWATAVKLTAFKSAKKVLPNGATILEMP